MHVALILPGHFVAGANGANEYGSTVPQTNFAVVCSGAIASQLYTSPEYWSTIAKSHFALVHSCRIANHFVGELDHGRRSPIWFSQSSDCDSQRKKHSIGRNRTQGFFHYPEVLGSTLRIRQKDVAIATSGYFFCDSKRHILLEPVLMPFSRIPSMKPSPKGKLVVVVEDDRLVREATSSLLNSWGCRVVAADCCGDAIAKLRELGERPDLIVCDYRLPQGSNGVDAIRLLRGSSMIPAFLISADPSSPGDEDGGAGYRLLHKPLSPKKFRALLVDASVLPA
jgi:CheY-like chemotaxis protein